LYGTGGPGRGLEGGGLRDKHIGSPAKTEPLVEGGAGPIGVGVTPSEVLVFVQPASKVPAGVVFAADPTNHFINNSGISIGLWAGRLGHSTLPIPASWGYSVGAYLTFSSAANCLNKK
jgi:hypothetical protein